MTHDEIAETLHNGNIALAREAILNANSRPTDPQPYASAVLTLDVVGVLAMLRCDQGIDTYPDFQGALRAVRRCLEGIT